VEAEVALGIRAEQTACEGMCDWLGGVEITKRTQVTPFKITTSDLRLS